MVTDGLIDWLVLMTSFYCPYFLTQYKKATLWKLRVAYNNVYRKILGLCRRSSASEMFVTNNILNFKALMRKSIMHLPVACQSPTMPLFAKFKNLG